MTFRSDEEKYFAEWLKEAVEAGLVIRWEYEPEVFEICPKTVGHNGKMAFQKAEYTPDFKIWLTPRGTLAFPKWAKHADYDELEGGHAAWIEIKGEFDHFRKDDRYVKLKIKLLFHLESVYVHFTKVPSIFKETWLPASQWLTKTGKVADNKTTRACLTLDQFCARIVGKQQEMKL